MLAGRQFFDSGSESDRSVSHDEMVGKDRIGRDIIELFNKRKGRIDFDVRPFCSFYFTLGETGGMGVDFWRLNTKKEMKVQKLMITPTACQPR